MLSQRIARHVQRLVKFVGFALLALAMLWMVGTRVGGVVWYTEFLGDQARDGFAIQDIAIGIPYTLGPPASVGGYALPPLYYYLPAVSSVVLGADPRVHVISNVVFSLAGFGLLLWFVWRFASSVPRPFRWLLVGVIATVWSMLWTEFTLVTREWNPSSLPFFLLAFTGLFEWLLRAHRDRPLVWYGNQAGAQRIAAWTLLGLCMAMLVSLHSLTLFIIPVIAVLLGAHLLWSVSARERWWALGGIVLATLVSQLALLPYWLGERNRAFANTQLIWKTIRETSEKTHYGPVDWLNHTVSQWVVGAQARVFPLSRAHDLAAFLLGVSLVGLVFVWSQQRDQLRPWLVVWLVFTLSASQYQGELFIHYSLPVVFVIIFGSAAIFALPWLSPGLEAVPRVALQLTLILLLVCSWQLQRTAFDIELNARFGNPDQRRITTTELTQLVVQAQVTTAASTPLCVPRGYEMSTRYIRAWKWNEPFDLNAPTVTSDCPAQQRLF